MDNALQNRLEEIGAPDDVKALAARLAEQAVTDPLTGLYNRRFFDEAMEQQIESARRYKRELTLVLFDLDHLKKINDTSGHSAGDQALKAFARLLKETARAADIVCRIGGDEFAALLPETGVSNGWKFVNRFFQTLEKEGIFASAGAAALPQSDLLAAADLDLRRAKEKKKI